MEHHKALAWHLTLNNRVSTRPKSLGGPLARSVEKCKTFSQTEPGAASSCWKCEFSLPNSFAPNDGLQIRIESVAESKNAASEKACCRAMALLLCSNPSQVVLRQSHWKIDVNDLVAGLPMECPGQQALPLPAPRAPKVYPVSPQLPDADGHAEATSLIKRCLYAHGGSFDPSRINNRSVGINAGEEKAHETLNRLLQRGTLRNFVEGHSEFRWDPKGRNGMDISWARPVLPSATSTAAVGSGPGSASPEPQQQQASQQLPGNQVQQPQQEMQQQQPPQQQPRSQQDISTAAVGSGPGSASPAYCVSMCRRIVVAKQKRR